MRNSIGSVGKWLLIVVFILLFLKFIDSRLGGVFPFFQDEETTIKVETTIRKTIEKQIDSVKIEGDSIPKSIPIRVAISATGSVREIKKEQFLKTVAQKKYSFSRKAKKVKVVDAKNAKNEEEEEEIIDAKQTKGKIKLKNSTLEYLIISNANNGDILLFKPTIETDLTTITKQTNTTKTISKSSLYLNFEPLFSFERKIIGGEVSLDYTTKRKLRIGAGFGYNNLIPLDKGYFKLKIGFKLW